MLWTREQSQKRQEILKELSLDVEPYWAQPWAKLPENYRDKIQTYYEPPQPSQYSTTGQKYVRFKSGPHIGSIVSVESWEREKKGHLQRGEVPPEVEYLSEKGEPTEKLLPALKPFEPYKFAEYVLRSNVFTDYEIPIYSGITGMNPHRVRDHIWAETLANIEGEFVKMGDLYVVKTPGMERPPDMRAAPTWREVTPLMSTVPELSPATIDPRASRVLPFAGFRDNELSWLGIFPDKTLSVAVKDFVSTPRLVIEDAFRRSRAIVSNVITNRELPFAAADKGQIWWLATIGDIPVEVHVIDVETLSERELEDMFSDSVAIIEEKPIEFLAKTEGDPLRKFCCRQCGECAPEELLEEGRFPDRIAWLRHHYKEKHPGMWGKVSAATTPKGIPRRLSLEQVSGLETRFPIEKLWADERAYLDKLTTEIEREGLTEPITIRVRDDGSLIVWDGIHRLAVAQKLGLKDIPVEFIGNISAFPKGLLSQQPAVIPTEPSGKCYEDAWRYLIKEEEGELIHGSVQTIGKRINHAWVELPTGFVWEPESGEFMKKSYFYERAEPQVQDRYTAEEAAIMAARTKNFGPWTEQERKQYLRVQSPTVIPTKPQGELTFLHLQKFIWTPGELAEYPIENLRALRKEVGKAISISPFDTSLRITDDLLQKAIKYKLREREVSSAVIPTEQLKGKDVRLIRDIPAVGLKQGDIVSVRDVNELGDVWLIKRVSPRETIDYGWTRGEMVELLSPAVIPTQPSPPSPKQELEFVSDSPEFLAFTIEDIGYREKLDTAFETAIARAKGG